MKPFLLPLPLLLSPALLYAVSANAIWQIQPNGSTTNAGGAGFDPSSTFSTNDLATDAGTATLASPVVSSALYSFASGDTNDWIYIQSGTHASAECWFMIVSVAAPKATLDAAAGHGFCRNTARGFPVPRFFPTTTTGITSDGTGTLTGMVYGIDRSFRPSAYKNASDLASSNADTTCTVTSAAYTFVATDIGNAIQISSGTGFNTGWYIITSISGGAVLDRSCGAGATASAGAYFLAGAIGLSSSTTGRTDANFFTGTHLANGNRVFLKGGGTYSPATAVTPAGGAATALITYEGYALVRGDAPTGTTRPIIDMGATAGWTTSAASAYAYLAYTGTGTGVFTAQTNTILLWIKGTNTSTTAGRPGITTQSAAIVQGYMVEGVSYRGRGLQQGGSSAVTYLYGCYFHDSDTGIADTATTGALYMTNCVIADNVTAGLAITAAHTGPVVLTNNTFYGAKNKLGTAISLITGAYNPRLMNNNFYGFTTVIAPTDTSTAGISLYNNAFNFTTLANIALWQPALNYLNVDPLFTGTGAVDQITGTGGTSVGNSQTLNDSGANFANVANNVDFLLITGSSTGTGVATNQKLLITGHTSTSVTVATTVISTTAATGLVYQITTGHNFTIGNPLLKGSGAPGVLGTLNMDIGGVQAPAGGGGGTGQTAHAFAQ